MKKQWTEQQKREVVRRCSAAKQNKETVAGVLQELGASSSQLCVWRKKYSDVPDEVYEAFGVEPPASVEPDNEDAGRIKVNDKNTRQNLAWILFDLGYIVWRTCETGDYFVNFQKQ